MPERESFPEVEPSDSLVMRFFTLWYTNDMAKQWKSNAVFHAYYLQLKRTIEAFPRMTSNTLHQYRPLAKFHIDRHFIYINACRDESKEEMQSYYKLTDEDMEEITKEWPAELLVPVEYVELSDPDIIRSPLVTGVEHDGQASAKKKKKKEEVQSIESDEEDSASEESRPDSPAIRGGDEVNQEEGREEGDKQETGEVTPPKDLFIEAETSKKRKVSLQKPSARKKTRANKPQSKNVFIVDDVDFIIAAMEDASDDILQRHEAKQKTLFEIIEKNLRDIQQAIYSSHAIPSVPPSSKIVELGDELAQLRRLADAKEAQLRRAQEEKEQATKTLKQEKEEFLEQLRAA
jgi:hypothetical protein